jgi:hypothetical protein
MGLGIRITKIGHQQESPGQEKDHLHRCVSRVLFHLFSKLWRYNEWREDRLRSLFPKFRSTLLINSFNSSAVVRAYVFLFFPTFCWLMFRCDSWIYSSHLSSWGDIGNGGLAKINKMVRLSLWCQVSYQQRLAQVWHSLLEKQTSILFTLLF